MGRKFLMFLTIVGVVSITGFTIGLPSEATNVPQGSLPSRQTPNLINGAVNPELVLDEVAYNLLFRLLSNLHRENEKQQIAAYLNIVFGCSDCNRTEAKINTRSAKRHIKILLAVIREYEQRIGALDHEARMIWERGSADFSAPVLARLRELDRRKREIIANLVASLPQRLGDDGMSKLQQHIHGQVKPNVKIYPEHEHE